MLANHTLLFLHIPKTGGTSLRAALVQCFEEAETCLVYPSGKGHISREAFIEMPEDERAKFRLVCGHFSFGFHRRVPGPVRYITMARHPLERVRSLYFHHYDRPQEQHHQATQGMTIGEFALSGLEPQTDNGMTRLLSGMKAEFGHCNADMLERALDNMRNHFLVVGTTERYQESASLLQKRLWLPLLEVGHFNSRKSPKRPIDNTMTKTILELNEFDLNLFHAVDNALGPEFPGENYSA